MRRKPKPPRIEVKRVPGVFLSEAEIKEWLASIRKTRMRMEGGEDGNIHQEVR